jgi:outer membrane murein-binding lipoprotein Lpp
MHGICSWGWSISKPERAMKTLFVVLSASLLLGCGSSRQQASLTARPAETVASPVAAEKVDAAGVELAAAGSTNSVRVETLDNMYPWFVNGGGSSRPPGSLTPEQAGTAARQLANEQADFLYHCQPFRDGQPVRFERGRWVWSESRGYGHGDVWARVELAADGSTNSVRVQFLDNQIRLLWHAGGAAF